MRARSECVHWHLCAGVERESLAFGSEGSVGSAVGGTGLCDVQPVCSRDGWLELPLRPGLRALGLPDGQKSKTPVRGALHARIQVTDTRWLSVKAGARQERDPLVFCLGMAPRVRVTSCCATADTCRRRGLLAGTYALACGADGGGRLDGSVAGIRDGGCGGAACLKLAAAV